MESRLRVSTPDTSSGTVGALEKLSAKAVSGQPGLQRDTAEYLSEMILELRNLARANQLYTVMVPLEFAYYEAFGVANRVDIPKSELERIKELSKASEELEQPAKAG